jgi:hypothetical protein
MCAYHQSWVGSHHWMSIPRYHLPHPQQTPLKICANRKAGTQTVNHCKHERTQLRLRKYENITDEWCLTCKRKVAFNTNYRLYIGVDKPKPSR